MTSFKLVHDLSENNKLKLLIKTLVVALNIFSSTYSVSHIQSTTTHLKVRRVINKIDENSIIAAIMGNHNKFCTVVMIRTRTHNMH